MDLHVDLREASGGSLRLRLERELRRAIQEGRLPAGTRLPATRELCAQLGVSRGAVQEAYSQLVAEGYLTARRGAGTVVAPSLRTEPPPPRRTPPATPVRHDLDPFRPALSRFPRASWVKALTNAMRRLPDARLGYADPAGAPELRRALASYLGRVRGVRAEQEQILITSGLRNGLSLVWAALAAGGARRIAVESPGWRGVSETAAAAGLEVSHIGLDDDGLLAGELAGQAFDAVSVAPAHQYPTGTVLSAARRAQLLAWARQTGGLIVEDDYDAEYRYDREPVGALQGLAPREVIYGGSASKSLAPSIRIGWLAVPATAIGAIETLQRTVSGSPPLLDQLALAEMIEAGELDRHLRRQRRLCRRRREALLDALRSRLPGLPIRGAAAGLFLVLCLPDGIDEQSVLTRAHAAGIAINGVGGRTPALVLGYASLPESAALAAVSELAKIVEAADAVR